MVPGFKSILSCLSETLGTLPNSMTVVHIELYVGSLVQPGLGQPHKACWNEGEDNSPGVMYKNFHRSNSLFDYFFSTTSERNSMLELSLWLNCY